MLTRIFAAIALSAVYGIALCAQGPADSERIRRVESGLRPTDAMHGTRGLKANIEERMQAYGIPGVSIAVFDGGRIVWAKGYGTVAAGADAPVTTSTLFQAGSVSKPVAALGALSLVAREELTLDEDVNVRLKSWKIPSNNLTANHPVTLRMLLSHSAGLTVHGFPGYEVGKPVPSLVQILNGEPPANTAAVRVDIQPGERMRYSGGGYTVLQQLLIDVSGQSFETFMASAVFRPLGMLDSTYSQTLPDSLATRVATGHYAGGAAVSGGHHLYPEMAAAGLWTTPTDLAKFAIYVQQAWAGAASQILSQEIAQEMLTHQKDGAGLGVFLSGGGQSARFYHDGVDEGFDAKVVSYIGTGRGAAIMANANSSRPLMQEIFESIAREYQWEGFPQTKQ
jgi:CubicO group peptidase (beta-lactamase class C family)